MSELHQNIRSLRNTASLYRRIVSLANRIGNRQLAGLAEDAAISCEQRVRNAVRWGLFGLANQLGRTDVAEAARLGLPVQLSDSCPVELEAMVSLWQSVIGSWPVEYIAD